MATFKVSGEVADAVVAIEDGMKEWPAEKIGKFKKGLAGLFGVDESSVMSIDEQVASATLDQAEDYV